MSKFAWVTLTTNDTYSLGALVLAHSLRRAGTVHQLAVLVTPGVSESMRQKLKEAYNVVQEVNVMDSQDSANLALLARPELGITFTKLHCWRLVQFEKCVFLDSDTLILQNCDELFEREEFSAAPDVSWPDCFNSGVFVYTPSQATFDKIVEFALKNGSFDGGDQGLLNQYFADWATSDNKKRLPFLYNVTAYASYCYLPAFKQFRDKIKILHFAGKMKPWLIHYNSQSKTASVPTDYTHASDLIQLWWNIFFDHVHAQLNTDMRYSCPSLIPWKCNYDNMRLQQQQEWQQIEYHSDSFQYEDEFHELYANDQIIEFHDPWEDYYRKQEEEAAADIQRHNTEDDHRNVMQDVHVVDYAREQNQVSHNFTREQNPVSQNFTREQEHVEEGDGVVAEEPHVSHNYAREQEHVGGGHHLGQDNGKEDHVSQEHVFDQCEGVHVSHNYTPQQEHVEEEPVSHNYTHGQDDTFDHHGDSEQIAQHTQEIELSTNVEAENFSRASSNYDNSATDTYHTGNDIECDSNSDYTSARSQQTLTPTDESCDDASTSRSIPVDTSSHVTQSVDKVNNHKSGEEVTTIPSPPK